MTNIKPRLLSSVIAARYCGISTHTLKRHGPPVVTIGRRKYYDTKTLDQWLDGLSEAKQKDAEAQALEALKT